MRSVSFHWFIGIILSLVFFVTLFPSDLFAQSKNSPPSVAISAGDIFEFTIDTPLIQPEFSWILSKDHRFLGAQRRPFFQTRQTDIGMYTLDVNIQDATRTHTEYYSVHIDVQPLQRHSFDSSVTNDSPPRAYLESVPPAVNGTVHLSSLGDVMQLRMDQSKGNLVSYNIDLDEHRDTDGDGNPSNDRDTQGTYSQQAGTPIFLFFQPQSHSRTITLTVQDASGALASDRLFVSFDDSQPATGQSSGSQRRGDFLITHHGMTASFSLDTTVLPSREGQLLYEWNFGDKTSSLQTEPHHTYTMSGSYTVSLAVRNILNGQIIYRGSTTIFVSPSSPPLSPSALPSTSSDASQSSTVSSATQNSSMIPSVKTIFTGGMIVISLTSFALLLLFIFLWIKRRASGSLQKTIEKMEQEIFEQKEHEIVSPDVPDVMPLMKAGEKPPATPSPPPDTDIIDRELAHTDFQSSATHDTVAPTTDNGPVPDWLAHAPSTLPEDSSSPALNTSASSPPSSSPIEPPSASSFPSSPPDHALPPPTSARGEGDPSSSKKEDTSVSSSVAAQHSHDQSVPDFSMPPSTLATEPPLVSSPHSSTNPSPTATQPSSFVPDASRTEDLPSPAATDARNLPPVSPTIRPSTLSTPTSQATAHDHASTALQPPPESSDRHTSASTPPSTTEGKQASSSAPKLSVQQGNPPPIVAHKQGGGLTPTQKRRLRRRRKKEQERSNSLSEKPLPTQKASVVSDAHSLQVDDVDISQQTTAGRHGDPTTSSDTIPAVPVEDFAVLPSLSDTTHEQVPPSAALQSDQHHISPKVEPTPLEANQPIATASVSPSSSHAEEDEKPLFVISADSLNEK